MGMEKGQQKNGNAVSSPISCISTDVVSIAMNICGNTGMGEDDAFKKKRLTHPPTN